MLAALHLDTASAPAASTPRPVIMVVWGVKILTRTSGKAWVPSSPVEPAQVPGYYLVADTGAADTTLRHRRHSGRPQQEGARVRRCAASHSWPRPIRVKHRHADIGHSDSRSSTGATPAASRAKPRTASARSTTAPRWQNAIGLAGGTGSRPVRWRSLSQPARGAGVAGDASGAGRFPAGSMACQIAQEGRSISGGW